MHLILFDPLVPGSLVTRLGPRAQPSTLATFDPAIFRSRIDALFKCVNLQMYLSDWKFNSLWIINWNYSLLIKAILNNTSNLNTPVIFKRFFHYMRNRSLLIYPLWITVNSPVTVLVIFLFPAICVSLTAAWRNTIFTSILVV